MRVRRLRRKGPESERKNTPPHTTQSTLKTGRGTHTKKSACCATRQLCVFFFFPHFCSIFLFMVSLLPSGSHSVLGPFPLRASHPPSFPSQMVPVNPTEDFIANALTGMSPRAILTAAFDGIQFWAGGGSENTLQHLSKKYICMPFFFNMCLSFLFYTSGTTAAQTYNTTPTYRTSVLGSSVVFFSCSPHQSPTFVYLARFYLHGLN